MFASDGLQLSKTCEQVTNAGTVCQMHVSMSVLLLKQVNTGVIALFVINIEDGRKRSRIALDLKRLPCRLFRRLRVDLYFPLDV